LPPALGDFVYADGSNSSIRNDNKTLIGLIYAITPDPGNESGTAYVIGSEYINNGTALYSGYNPISALDTSTNSTLKALGILKKWLEGKLSNYEFVELEN
jgi:hypothetical protein